MTAVAQLVRTIVRKTEPPERRTGSKVRRDSHARGRARRNLLTWYQANERIRAIERWERKQQRPDRAKNRAVGHIGIALYRYLARRAVIAKGALDDLSYSAIAAVIGHSKSAVVEAAKRLKAAGWLDWTRQFRVTGEAGRRGPQVEQDCNAYVVLAPEKALLAVGIRLGPAPPPDDHDAASSAGRKANAAAAFADSKLGAAMAKLGAAVAKQRDTADRSESMGT